METINHEYYVSLEVAKLLKEAGFDYGCREYYKFTDEGYRFRWNALPVNWNKKVAALIAEKYGLSEGYSALTLDVAQRWLREVKGILLYITPKRVNMEWKWFFWYIDLRDKTNIEQRYSTKNFNTYEKAQEAGIKKALEIILEKGD